jgi:hypothetical protein
LDIIPSLILSVYTDRLLLSVIIADGIYRILKRSNDVMTWNFFKWCYRQNDRGIQIGISVQWRGPFIVRITDETCLLVIPSVKANIYTLCWLSPPLFLLFLPHPDSSLPNCNQPPIPTLLLFLTQALKFLILLYVVTTSVLRLIYCGFYHFL